MINAAQYFANVVETNCLVAEYRIPYRIGPRTVITHAHRGKGLETGARDAIRYAVARHKL